jgi:hypothetical protein
VFDRIRLAFIVFDFHDLGFLLLLGDTTHVIAAFYIGIACPLKTNFKDELSKRIERLIKADPRKRKQPARL